MTYSYTRFGTIYSYTSFGWGLKDEIGSYYDDLSWLVRMSMGDRFLIRKTMVPREGNEITEGILKSVCDYFYA